LRRLSLTPRFSEVTSGGKCAVEQVLVASITPLKQDVNEIWRRMKDQQPLGDTSPEIFREQLHRLADWIADFRENIETLRVAPDDKPGAILTALSLHTIATYDR